MKKLTTLLSIIALTFVVACGGDEGAQMDELDETPPPSEMMEEADTMPADTMPADTMPADTMMMEEGMTEEGGMMDDEMGGGQ